MKSELKLTIEAKLESAKRHLEACKMIIAKWDKENPNNQNLPMIKEIERLIGEIDAYTDILNLKELR